VDPSPAAEKFKSRLNHNLIRRYRPTKLQPAAPVKHIIPPQSQAAAARALIARREV
jgi:hypothetical protein